ncbi:MAG: type II secretion system F family protein [Holosporaceae bacterium]|jgi:type II secretory pathway component PulF|nr:type II secretion system F family protein [Holosporaceae bacterium]
MPIYEYQVLTKDGLRKNGSLMAESYGHAHGHLLQKQQHPIRLKRVYFPSRRVNVEDLLMFFLHMDFQLKCRVGIDEAIESFIDFHGNKILSASLAEALEALKNGEGIGASFEKCGNIFDGVTVGLLKSAEKTGRTSEVILNVLDFLKLQANWKNNLRRTVAYPIFMAAVAILVLILSVGILGPQVAALVQNFNGEMPALTKFTLELLPKISIVAGHLLPPASVLVALLFLREKGREILSQILLKTPKIGALITKISLWQFCKILHIALEAKLDFVEALDLAIESVTIKNLRNELKNVRERVIEGHKISESFSRTRFIKGNFLVALRVGEEGNNLASSFGHMSETQYRELQFDVRSLGQFLGVGLTVFTGFILIFILCSLFYPIYSYVEMAGA